MGRRSMSRINSTPLKSRQREQLKEACEVLDRISEYQMAPWQRDGLRSAYNSVWGVAQDDLSSIERAAMILYGYIPKRR